jgi:hypothetical protein
MNIKFLLRFMTILETIGTEHLGIVYILNMFAGGALANKATRSTRFN